MELVVDTNVLLAALLKEAISRELLLDTRLRIFAPEHLIIETQKHLRTSSSLRKRIQLTAKELESLFFLLTEYIETIPEKEFASRMPEAIKLASHKEDSPYLGLALHFNIPIWSNDKGMRSQNRVKVYTTKDLLGELTKQ